MQSPWLAYVPAYVAHNLLTEPTGALIGREQRFLAVSLIADLSGFTPLSEALGRHGRNGTEELSTLLNHSFGPMLALIAQGGGTVGKWSGDGLIVIFPVADNPDSVVQQAVSCAHAMQAHMQTAARLTTSAGPFELQLRIGLAFGPVLSVLVGVPTVRLEYVLGGSVLDRCAAAEQQAAPGEIVLHADLTPWAAQWTVEPLASGDLRLLAIEQPALPLAPSALSQLSMLLDQQLPFVHPLILERLGSGQRSFINEHRKTSILFVQFSGFDYDIDPAVGSRLAAYLAAVVNCVQHFDGYLMQVDMDDKGSKYIILCGAPVAHENDELRALRCALMLRELGVPVRIGINTGVVFCGNLGTPERQHYTVLGDAVNLAARLMQAAAPDQILVSAATQQAAAARGSWQQLAPLQVKGRTASVEVWALADLDPPLQAALELPTYALPMVGRTAELEQMTIWLSEAQRSRGQLVAISAEAGMGKSRLGAEVLRLAHRQGLNVAHGECVSFGSDTPYLVWQPILRQVLGLPARLSDARQAEQLAAHLAVLGPDYEQRLPLLGAIFNLVLPANDLTARLKPKQQKEARETLLVDLLRWHAAQTPLLIALEDCHWIDPLSLDLLHALSRTLVDAPLLVLLIQRPSAPDALLAPLQRLPYVHLLNLAPFSPAEAETLIRQKLAAVLGTETPRAPALINQLTARAQGNPFYLDELINLIHDRGLDVHDPATLANLELPASLHSLILSRIDPLPEREKITLKIASVIGQVFRAAWIWAVQPELGTPEMIISDLDRLRRLDLTPLEHAEPELVYAFRHIVVQEVAYESITYATRAMLHEQVALLIERQYPEELDRYLDLLALHYGRSHNPERQRIYLAKAGDAAAAVFANDAAISYYEQVLPLLPAAEQGAVMLKLADVFERVGRWPEADALYAQVVAYATEHDDPQLQAASRTAWAGLLYQQGKFAQVEALVADAMTFYEATNDLPGKRQVYNWLGAVAVSQGHYAQAQQIFEQQYEIAVLQQDHVRMWRAKDHMVMLAINQGDVNRAFEMINMLVAERGIDVASAPNLSGRLGFIHNERGEYEQALHYFGREFEATFKTGNLRSISHEAIHMGQVYLHQGDYTRSDECCRFLLQVALRLGDQVGMAVALILLADSALAEERLSEALTLCEAALTIGRGLGIAYVTAFLLTRARIALLLNDGSNAAAAAEEALTRANAARQIDVLLPAQIIQLQAQLLLGQHTTSAVVARLESWLAEEDPTPQQQAALLYARWQVQPSEPFRQAAIDHYSGLMTSANNAEQRRQYATLTGVPQPDPQLPPLPAIISAKLVPISELLAQVFTFIAAQAYAVPAPTISAT